MGRAEVGKGQSAPAATGWSAVGIISAYAAAFVAFAYAVMSLYWAAGGHALVSTIGGYVEQFARRGGALPVLVALAVTLAKVAGGLLALALVRPSGRVVPRGWLHLGSAAVSVLLLVYGGFNVLLGALVLSADHPPGGKRGPDSVALARRGMGPVVPGVGDLASAGGHRLPADDNKSAPMMVQLSAMGFSWAWRSWAWRS